MLIKWKIKLIQPKKKEKKNNNKLNKCANIQQENKSKEGYVCVCIWLCDFVLSYNDIAEIYCGFVFNLCEYEKRNEWKKRGIENKKNFFFSSKKINNEKNVNNLNEES